VPAKKRPQALRSAPASPSSPEPATLLACGAVRLKGRMPWSSNATFLVELVLDGTTAFAVYKPARGERPLWDFPPELYKREIAAYLLSEALGWNLVPLTIGRRDGPYGEGSFQLFVQADFEQHFFTLVEDTAHHDRLKGICLFDLLANNADRKSGHLLLGPDRAIYAIDNALTFHADPKLRTVIWNFGGEPIPDPLLADIRRVFEADLPRPLADLLDSGERRALAARARAILRAAHFPRDDAGHRYPWPPV
jgi:uncharacterized repeat protein (TIGR03843 family)